MVISVAHNNGVRYSFSSTVLRCVVHNYIGLECTEFLVVS